MAYCNSFKPLTGSKSTSCTNCKNWHPGEQGGSCIERNIVLKK